VQGNSRDQPQTQHEVELGSTSAETSQPIAIRESHSEIAGTSELKQMLAGMLAAIQESNAKFQESVKLDLGQVKNDISSSSEKVNKLVESNATFQEYVKADIGKIRSEIKDDHEKLIRRFESQSQKYHKEFSAKLDSESRRLTGLVGRVQKETNRTSGGQETNSGSEFRVRDQARTE
jgi:hypothetical protein